MMKSSVVSESRFGMKPDNAGIIQTPLRITGVD